MKPTWCVHGIPCQPFSLEAGRHALCCYPRAKEREVGQRERSSSYVVPDDDLIWPVLSATISSRATVSLLVVEWKLIHVKRERVLIPHIAKYMQMLEQYTATTTDVHSEDCLLSNKRQNMND